MKVIRGGVEVAGPANRRREVLVPREEEGQDVASVNERLITPAGAVGQPLKLQMPTSLPHTVGVSGSRVT